MDELNRLRQRYRLHFIDAVLQVVVDSRGIESVAGDLNIAGDEANAFLGLLSRELTQLEAYNWARFRLDLALTERWVSAGRPGPQRVFGEK